MKIKIVTSILALALLFAPTNENVLADAKKSIEYIEPSYIDEVTVSIGKFAGTIELTGTYSIVGSPGIVLKPGKYNIKNSTNTVSLESNGESIYKSNSIKIFPINYSLDNLIKVGKNGYLGSVSFESNRVINNLPLEHYLYGVVPNEIGANVHIEAQKAQAVSARSYAATKSGKVMVSNTTDQIYYGFNKSNVKSVEAVNSTQGQVMKSNGKVVSTYYSSSNGGITNSAKNIWGGQNNSYLTRKNDEYDENYKWEVNLSKYQLEDLDLGNKNYSDDWDLLIEKGTGTKNFDSLKRFMVGKSYKVDGVKAVIPKLNNFKVSEIKNIAFNKSDVVKDGDVLTGNLEIEIVVRDRVTGKVEVGTFNYSLNSYKFYTERVFGELDSRKLDTMHSANIKEVIDDGRKVIIRGSGYGHGVGMSQKGAISRAEAGMSFKEILSFYYNGISLTNLKAGPVYENRNPVEWKGNEILHKVVKEDTLYSISKKYEVSVNQIKVWNDIDSSNLIKLGSFLLVGYEEIEVPEKQIIKVKEVSGLYEKIDGLDRISILKVGEELELVENVVRNWMEVTYKGKSYVFKDGYNKTNKAPSNYDKEKYEAHVVKKGESVEKISSIYMMNKQEILTLNKMNANGILVPGEVILVNKKAEIVDTNQYHIVKRGDTLYRISVINKISVNDLKKMNGLKNNVISVGQKLLVKVESNEVSPVKPEPVDTNQYYVVKRGDTLYRISVINKISVNELKKMNGLKNNAISVGQKLLVKVQPNESIPKKPVPDKVLNKSHTVTMGDTLYALSIKYKVSVSELKKINKLKSETLFIGQKLIVGEASTKKSSVSYGSHKVVSGDTLYRVAIKYKMTVDELVSINKLASKNSILRINQILKVK